MSTPPPLPARHGQDGLHRHAATAGLVAPLLAVIVALLFNFAGQVPATHTAQVIRTVACGFLVLAGLGCAVTALCGIPRHGKRGLLVRGITGTGLNAALIAAMLLAAIASAGKRAQTRREAWSDFESAARDLRTGMRTNYSPETGLTNDMGRQMAEFQSRLESAAQIAQGDDAIVMQATAALTALTQEKLAEFGTATDGLTKVEPGNLSTLTNRSQIEDRRSLVNKFIAANASLKEFLARQDGVVEAELRARNLAPVKVRTYLTAFRSSQATLLPKVAAIRTCDDQVGRSLLKILDIAEAQWGRWKYDPETQITVFQDGQAADAYNAQVDVMEQAAARQIQLQGELLKLQQRAAEARERSAR